jgi:hypothetical protein
MSSPSFGLPGTSNNAPPPPRGNTNPTGNVGGVYSSNPFSGPAFGSFGNTQGWPQLFSTQPSSPVTPSSNAPLFSGTSGGLASMGSGFDLGTNWSNLANELGKAYGKGPGQAIYNILSEGLFNPQEAAAFLNAMQPSIHQGEASVLNAFGAEGSRFGSAAALGLGNYESQVNLNEQQTLASMYMQAQQDQLQLLEGVLPTLHGEKANSGGWIHDLIGGLEIAGGVLAAPFTGGASLPLVGMGAQQLGQGLAPGNNVGGGNSFGPLPSFGTGGFSNMAPFGSNPTAQGNFVDQWMLNEQSQSAAADLGGASTAGTSSIPGFLYGLP